MADLKPSDVDAFYLYDAFTPMVLWALERFGHCRVGEGMDFVQDGRIELGGKLPVDTNGGMLSEGHLNGWGHFLEIISQLRGTAGARQVAGAKVAQWGTCIGDSILFGARGQT
jgi:acetyl-CoA acetyltransferase